MSQILVFGASITYGAWDREGGWVQRLREFLDEKNLSDPDFYCLTYNLGISGDTAEDLLERFEFETKQRFKEAEDTIFIFDIGLNDSQFIHSKKGLRFSPDEFKSNIKKLIGKAKKLSNLDIIFVGLTPVDESKVNPIPWAEDKSYRNEYVKQFNDLLKSVCKEENVHFIEVFEDWMQRNYELLLDDGVHPNSEGHKEIFEAVKEFLAANKML